MHTFSANGIGSFGAHFVKKKERERERERRREKREGGGLGVRSLSTRSFLLDASMIKCG